MAWTLCVAMMASIQMTWLNNILQVCSHDGFNSNEMLEIGICSHDGFNSGEMVEHHMWPWWLQLKWNGWTTKYLKCVAMMASTQLTWLENMCSHEGFNSGEMLKQYAWSIKPWWLELKCYGWNKWLAMMASTKMTWLISNSATIMACPSNFRLGVQQNKTIVHSFLSAP